MPALSTPATFKPLIYKDKQTLAAFLLINPS
ncbi:hypothetical protein EMIT0P395_140061 [Pseudomonas sp. IT-P395]